MLLFLPKDLENDNEKKEITLLQEMLDGIKYVKKRKSINFARALFYGSRTRNWFNSAVRYFIVTEQLGLSKESLQWLLTVNGAGMIVGGALAMVFAKRCAAKDVNYRYAWSGNRHRYYRLFHQFMDNTHSTTFSGLALPCIQIGINTLIIQNSDTDFIGRVNGILSPLFTGSMVVTMSIAGSLKEMFSLSTMYEGTALLFIIDYYLFYLYTI